MPSAHRLGDIGTGHSCYPPRPNVEASPNVFVNGIAWHRQGDAWGVHCCPGSPPPCHAGTLSAGSSTVFVNGKQAARVGDPVSCGSAAAIGSSNVFAGG